MTKQAQSIRVKEGAMVLCALHKVWVGLVRNGRVERYSYGCNCQPVDLTYDPPAEILR